jgi:pyrroline-5-carboxylate reductase
VKIAFIGAGRMAEALIQGLLLGRVVPRQNIIASDSNASRLKYITQKYKVKTYRDNLKAVGQGNVIVLAVKPQVMREVLSEIGPVVRSNRLIISIAAGITLNILERAIPQAAVIRAMPNNPCLVQAGISALCKGKKAKEKDIKTAKLIFGVVGETVAVEEKFMDAVTGLSGSGPAFVYLSLEGFMEAGKKMGMNKKVAEKLALQMVFGSIKTVLQTGKTPAELREMVTSPGGTTLAGLKILRKGKFKEILVKAVEAAAKRSKELSRTWK